MKQNKQMILLLGILFTTTFLMAGDATTGSTLTIIFGAFISGVLLTFTPCVLPMVPIVSSIIAGQGEEVTKRKAVILAVSYVLGTAATYAVMGALAGATGEHLQAYFQNIWAIGFMTLIFIVMALSMFELFTMQLPVFIQSKLNTESQGIKGGNIGMVFVLGMISALILGACVSPVLISFLSVAIATSDATLGTLTMFALAMGMGVPLILLGFGAGYLIPKAGMWMDKVKYFFGVLLLAVAIEIFSSLELVNTLLLWGAFTVGIAVYLGATKSLSAESNGWHTLQKAVATVLLIWGSILMVGAGYGQTNMSQPLPKPTVVSGGGGDVLVSKFPFENIYSMDEYNKKLEYAKNEYKPMILFFHSDSCPVCTRLKETTLLDRNVQQKLQNDFIAVGVNIGDKSNEDIAAIKKQFEIFGPPGFAFVDEDGDIMDDKKFYGYSDAEEFYDTLDLITE